MPFYRYTSGPDEDNFATLARAVAELEAKGEAITGTWLAPGFPTAEWAILTQKTKRTEHRGQA